MLTETELTLIILDLTEQISEIPSQKDTLFITIFMGAMTVLLGCTSLYALTCSGWVSLMIAAVTVLCAVTTYSLYCTYIEIPVTLADLETQRLYYANLYESLYGPVPPAILR